ncbi:hypothetical protein Mnod_7601 [Methylobacterium nodulans ORS 2060]|uniref:PD(D/E)XK endonuclease domain-containing protein n=2 Tax=Methylobacterium nodulans TaxID=114616 RepID=B8IPP5_METNO|nr:hypothetical protein Mnod_7601 [Methylobacterium nodulans ORS 2060]
MRVNAARDCQRGDSAEAYVTHFFLREGFDAHGTRRAAPFDHILTFEDGSMHPVLVQTKHQLHPNRGRWRFNFRCGNPRTGSGSRPYPPNAYHISACVALSIGKVLFCAGVKPYLTFTTAQFMREKAELESLHSALETIRLRSCN